ncbi:hypothetical protein E7Z59_07830 [Robertkochia marina]|uniref:Tail specific protease domain-containing protein n=1 Tax=Robertkochia marina TaxID=1227945 RepID=A0A4S3LZL6_9FLAO|nr:S41 family peptidase [Robertkochia marina]THD67562.1 hypothetical protein E7Z59_07830 [Robertkochia marina]TRZ44570.1 hypothetical protein D3A96_08115 [Robertkochia marina]
MRITIRITFCLLIFLFTSCKRKTPSGSLDGNWYADGYSLTLIIKNKDYEFLDTYQNVCIKKERGALSKLEPHLKIVDDTLQLFKGTSVYHFTGNAAVTNRCSSAPENSNDVLMNFDAFAYTVQVHYAFDHLLDFSIKDTLKSERKKLEKTPSELQLYQSIETVLSAMNDNHGYLEVPEEVIAHTIVKPETIHPEKASEEKIPQSTSETQKEYGDFEVADRVSDIYIDEELTRNTSLIRWGKMKDSLGYMQIKAMWLFADLDLEETTIKEKGFVNAYVQAMQKEYEGTYIEKERLAVAALLDTIMNDLKDTKAMIVDVRFNGGGQDVASMEILKKFNQQKRAVARKKARAGSRFSDQQTIYLESAPQAYIKPVFLLTSRQTASAADFIALASMELPNFTRIGTATQGALSDALEKQLPNGWYFSISNELYFDMDHNNYEYRGVPPHIKMVYPEDRQEFFHKMMRMTLKDKMEVMTAVHSVLTAK